MNENQIRQITQACDALYGRYCLNKQGELKFRPTLEGIAEQAAYRGYQPSIMRSAAPRSMKNISKNLRDSLKNQSESMISTFLVNNFNLENGYNMDSVYQLMDDIRTLYHNNGINDYTYGNAQKIVSVAMKYFFWMLHKFNFINIFDEASNPFKGYNYSIVDKIILTAETNVRFSQNVLNSGVSWSKTDDFDAFKNFQINLKNYYGEEIPNLYFYEAMRWAN